MIGGSINRGGSVTFHATRVGSETALAQIVALVERAQSSKALGQRLADQAAQWLVILAVGSGILTFVVWYFFGGETAILALTFAISAVVIACLDALGLATPTATAVGTGIGARHNILIEDAAALENISRVSMVVFDKTGTLTEGRPGLTDLLPVAGADIEVVMLMVDNRRTSEVLPSEQSCQVAALQAEGRTVAMVGDGVNDAPALATADIGIAIGAGTDVAVETASVGLMKSDPLDVLRAIVLSKATVRKMKQNLAWASVYNVLAIPVAGVFYPAWGIMLRPE